MLKKLYRMFMEPCDAITVEEFDDKRDSYHVLDVREEWERKMGTIEPSIKIPMGEVPNKINKLPTDKPIVVLCRSGARSARVTMFLKEKGFTVYNLSGGILAWRSFADPSIQQY